MSGAATKITEKMSDDAYMAARVLQGRPPSFLLLYHRDGMVAVRLQPDTTVTIGRGSPPELSEPSLSKPHASFTLRDDRVHVEDLESTNGTLVGGERVTRTELRHGDEATLGGVIASVYLGSGGERTIGGVEGHEQSMARLAVEIERAVYFGRDLALALVRGAPGQSIPFPRLHATLATRLRPVDRIGMYSETTAEILLPELDVTQVEERMSSVARAATQEQSALLVGAALLGSGRSADELLERAHDALSRATLQRPVVVAPARLWDTEAATSSKLPAPVFASDAMRDVFDAARRVARGNISVLILGETGTGKEVIARIIHEHSPRRSGRLVVVNCAAIPATLVEATLFGHERGAFTGADKRQIGLFEAADGGTLVLDEVGDLPLGVQPTLLRTLETGTMRRVGATSEIDVDVRVIASTNADLQEMMLAGKFRKDLFYRLSAMVIGLPPLRNRPEDIDPLIDCLLERACTQNRLPRRALDPAARAMLRTYPWPGNVRELFNAIARAAVIARSDIVRVEDLPDQVRKASTPPGPTSSLASQSDEQEAAPPRSAGPRPGGTFKERLQEFEEETIRDALRRTDGNQNKAALLLDMPLRTLTHKIRLHKIKRPGY